MAWRGDRRSANPVGTSNDGLTGRAGRRAVTTNDYARRGLRMALGAFAIPALGILIVNEPLSPARSMIVRMCAVALVIGSAVMMAVIVIRGSMMERALAVLAILSAGCVVWGYVWSCLTRDDPAAFGTALPIVYGFPLLVLTTLVTWQASVAAGSAPRPGR